MTNKNKAYLDSTLSLVKESEYKQQADQIHILNVRHHFFDTLVREWSRQPELIDEVMGQAQSFLVPDFLSNLKDDPDTIYIHDVERGLLSVSVTPPVEEGQPKLRWVYSVMHAGDWLRYGVLIQGDPKLILRYERYQDHMFSMERIWDRPCDYLFRDDAGLLLEWRFQEPEFYHRFDIRERFSIIARHLHFRLGKIMLPLVSGEPEQEIEVEHEGKLSVSSYHSEASSDDDLSWSVSIDPQDRPSLSKGEAS